MAPAIQRLDTLEGTLHAMQRALLESAQRQQALSGIAQTLNWSIADVLRDVGHLHSKADENTLKSRPLIHLGDVYGVPLADGYIFVPEGDEDLLLMFAGATSHGLEPGVRRVVQAALDPGGYAVDAGANIGMHTLAMARAVGALGQVHAFEPEPRLTPVLERTLRFNGQHQVSVHRVALGAKDDTATFNVSATIGHSSLYDLGRQDLTRDRIEVPLRRLDTIVPANTPVDLIKMDVEGAELDVLSGANRVLSDSPDCAIVAECGPSHLERVGQSLETWFDAFSEVGFAAYAISEPHGQLARTTASQVAGLHSVNILFVRPGSKIEVRLIGNEKLAVSP